MSFKDNILTFENSVSALYLFIPSFSCPLFLWAVSRGSNLKRNRNTFFQQFQKVLF